MEKAVKVGNSYNHGSAHMEFLINSLATDADSTIQAELATLPACAPGSTANNATLDVICIKGNDGNWKVLK